MSSFNTAFSIHEWSENVLLKQKNLFNSDGCLKLGWHLLWVGACIALPAAQCYFFACKYLHNCFILNVSTHNTVVGLLTTILEVRCNECNFAKQLYNVNVDLIYSVPSQVVQLQFLTQSKHQALHGSLLNEIHIQAVAAHDDLQSSCSECKDAIYSYHCPSSESQKVGSFVTCYICIQLYYTDWILLLQIFKNVVEWWQLNGQSEAECLGCPVPPHSSRIPFYAFELRTLLTCS